MTDKMKCLSAGEWLVKHASHMLGNGIEAHFVLGLWFDHDPVQAEIEEIVIAAQVGPGFNIDGVDDERGVIQLSTRVGFEDTNEANSYFNDWLEELTNKPLAELAILRFKMTWTQDVHAELSGRSLPQFIDKKFLQNADAFMESES